MDQGSPRLSTKENMDLIEELVCSQEEQPNTHLAPSKIVKQTGISESYIWKMVKKRKLNCLKTPQSVNLQNNHLYGKGKKSDIPDENLVSSTIKMFKNV